MNGARLFLPQWTEVPRILHRIDYKERYPQGLMRHTGLAASYLREVLQSLEEEGFMEVRRTGHIHRLVLTASGTQLAFHLIEAERLLSAYPSRKEKSRSWHPDGTPTRPRKGL